MKVIQHQLGRYTKDGKTYDIRTDQPDTRTVTQYAVENGYARRSAEEVLLDHLRFHKKKTFAAARYVQEMGGLTLPNAMRIRTDERTRSVLTAGCLRADKDRSFVFANWKLSDGTFADLDAKTVINMNDAVAAHIANCFAKEKKLCDSVDAAITKAEIEAILW